MTLASSYSHVAVLLAMTSLRMKRSEMKQSFMTGTQNLEITTPLLLQSLVKTSLRSFFLKKLWSAHTETFGRGNL